MGADKKISVDIPYNPLVVDYFTRLMNACEVTKYLCIKSKNKGYKVAIIYLPRVLPFTKKMIRDCKPFGGPYCHLIFD